jgi:hypothetical protein
VKIVEFVLCSAVLDRKTAIWRACREVFSCNLQKFASLQTGWRSGKDSNHRCRFEPLNPDVSVTCRKQIGGREFHTINSQLLFFCSPVSVRPFIDPGRRIEGDSAGNRSSLLEGSWSPNVCNRDCLLTGESERTFLSVASAQRQKRPSADHRGRAFLVEG